MKILKLLLLQIAIITVGGVLIDATIANFLNEHSTFFWLIGVFLILFLVFAVAQVSLYIWSDKMEEITERELKD